jgi:hypothetical protein
LSEGFLCFFSIGELLALREKLRSFTVLKDSIVLGSLLSFWASPRLSSLGLSLSTWISWRLLRVPIS